MTFFSFLQVLYDVSHNVKLMEIYFFDTNTFFSTSRILASSEPRISWSMNSLLTVMAILSSADALQSLSYSLCHVYAPSTRAVSIPAPVYCTFYNPPPEICWHEMNLLQDADMVCSRAKTHFDPTERLRLDTSTNASGSTNLEVYKDGYRPLHPNQQKAMYFAVRSRICTEIVSLISKCFL